MDIQNFSSGEERLNAITHGIGILFAIIGLPILLGLFKNQDANLFLGVLTYSICFLILFIASTLYHATYNPYKKHLLHKLDHIAIYFMIAGSYTPFVLKALGGTSQWIFLTSVWTIVLLGTLYKVFFFGKYERLSLIIYITMGWILIFQIGAFYENLPTQSLLFIISGGIAYSAGVYFFTNDHKKYYHSVWHLFTLAGSLLHFIAVLFLL